MVGALLIFGWRCWFLYQEAQLLYLQVTLQSSTAGQVQLYYDRGYGFNEHDSVVVYITKDRQKLWGVFPWPENWSDRSYQHYRFQLPPSAIYALRFDPFLISGTMRIKSIEVVDGLGHHQRAIDLNKLKPANLIKELSIRDQGGGLVFDSPLMLDRSRSFLRAGFIGRVLIELIVIFLVVAFLLMLKRLAPSATFVKFAVRQLSYLRNPLIQDWIIFVFLTALFFWIHRPLDRLWFPVLFQKALFCILVILTVRYFLTRGDQARKMVPLLYGIFFYLLWIAISTGMHYFALESVGLENYIAVSNTSFSGTVFNKYEGIKLLTDYDWSEYVYFFPFLFIVSILLFGSTDHGWKKLTWIPLIFIPCLLVALFQVYIDRGFLNIRQQGDLLDGLTNLVSFRILLFLIFPLCVFAGVIEKQWWKKALFLLLAVVILWLTKLTYGRAAIFGILMFIVMLPMIRLWVHGVHGFRSIALHSYVYVGLSCIFGLAILAGVIFPKYHGFISKLLPERVVFTSYNIIRGNIANPRIILNRTEMAHQAWRLTRESPVSGWGPAGFQKNVDRIRFVNEDYRGHRGYAETNLYSQMTANFGILGVSIVLFLYLIPLWMIFRVRKQIQNHEERWAVGIVFVTVSIMLLLFTTNQNINYLEVNWLYSLFFGFLVSVALKYGYASYPIKSWFWGIGGLILTIVFIAGIYDTTFGSHGYKAIRKELTSRITRGYCPDDQVIIWDNKKMTGTNKFWNILGKIRGTPYRMKYTTNHFRMHATSNPFRMQATSNLYCVRISITQRSDRDTFILGLKVFLNDKDMRDKDKYKFYISGEKMLYYYVPDIENNEVEIKVKVDLVRTLPYHEDFRTEVNQRRYMPYHVDYRDLGVTVSVIPFIKTLSKNGI